VRRYRTYTDADFRKLREIEALRFLGFTRTQIKSLLRGGRADIIEAIHAQRLTVEHSLKQLARASEVLAESETYLRSGDQPSPLLAVREWNAMIAAEIGDDPETIAAVALGWKPRAMWPTE
jgi:DNA-binding transcriptional MerR regulator